MESRTAEPINLRVEPRSGDLLLLFERATPQLRGLTLNEIGRVPRACARGYGYVAASRLLAPAATVRHFGFPDCRSFVAGRYVIYYRPASESVEIARVLHSARDLQSLRIER